MDGEKASVLPALRRLRGIGLIFRAAAGGFLEDNGLQVASSLTFITILSLVPLVAISLSVLSRFKFSQEAFLNFLYQYFIPTPELREIITQNLQTFIQQTATLSILGGLFLIFTAISLLNTIEGTLNQIWGIREDRPLLYRFVSFWSVITLAPVLIATALILSSGLTASPLLGVLLHFAWVRGIFQYLLPYFLIFLAVFIIFRVFSSTRVGVKSAAAGALIVTVLFQLARWGFGVYLEHFANFHQIYGILGTLPAFFLWIYVCWVVFLIGAEAAYFLQNGRRQSGTKGAASDSYRLYHALKALMIVGRSFREGKDPLPRAELEKRLDISARALEEILRRLREKGIVAEVGDEAKTYLPARSLERILLPEVLEAVYGDPFRLPAIPTPDPDDQFIRGILRQSGQELGKALEGLSLESLLGPTLPQPRP